MLIGVLIIILIGCIAALVFYYQEKNKEASREINRLKKNIVSTGYNFEQLEFGLEKIKKDIECLQKERDISNIQNKAQIIELQLEEIIKMLNSSSRSK